MSANDKGNAVEKLVLKLYQDQGWTVERAKRKYIRLPDGRTISKNNDFFGLFDLTCYHPSLGHHLVQTCHAGGGSERRKAIAESAAPFIRTASLMVYEYHKGLGSTRPFLRPYLYTGLGTGIKAWERLEDITVKGGRRG